MDSSLWTHAGTMQTALDWLEKIFDINQSLLTWSNYSMSYLEFFGTLFNVSSVYLVSKKNILNWPIGIIGAFLFASLFYQLRLYADFFEQIYYVLASLYGLYYWLSRSTAQKSLSLSYSSLRVIFFCFAVTIVIGVASGFFLSQLHQISPQFFPEPASLPWLDGLTSVASFVAMLLMARGRIECWFYWMAINLLSIGLYSLKQVYFIAALYALYLVLALFGWRQWRLLRHSS